MIHKFKDINIYYETYGSGEDYVLFLHGWGGSSKSFSVFYDKMLKNKKLLNLDFPPFRESDEPKNPLTVEDYCDMVKSLIDFLEIKKVSIICHSFGGRVAISFANRYNDYVDKMIFIDTAGLKYKFSITKELKILKYKFKKKLGLNTENFGSNDYKQLSPVMKQTFVNIVNYDQTQICKNITNEVLILWGKEDKETPLYMAKKLNKLIKNSALIVFENSGHFSHYDNFYQFTKIVDNFLKG